MKYDNIINNPLVSVTVLTYNSSRFVLETLESIKAQTYKNIELIISDDCSTDNSVEICKQWLENNKERFVETHLITHPVNTGIPANKNRALEKCRGEWIKGIGADDVLEYSAISKCVDVANKRQNIELLIGDLIYIDSNSIIFKYDDVYKKHREYFLSLSGKKQLKSYVRLPVFLNTPSFFIKKKLIDRLGGYDNEFKIYEDMPFIIKALVKGVEIHKLDEVIAFYRVSDHSVSRSKDNYIDALKKEELNKIFNKYRKPHLSKFNIIDVFVYYDNWINNIYKGFSKFKGRRFFQYLNLNYWLFKMKIYY